MNPSAADLQSILDRVPVMICRCDAAGRYLFANQAYVARFKRTPESLIGLHISEVIGAPAYAVIAPYVSRVLGGERVEFELEVPYQPVRRVMRCSYHPDVDGDGHVTGFVAAITDETARLRAEEALRISREHLEFIVESTEIGVWSCELPFDVLIWNAKCKEHFGLPHDAVVTIGTFYERMHPDDVERTRVAIDMAIANHVSYDTEYRTHRAEGGFRWVRAIGRAAYAADGTPLRFDGVTVDITGQKSIEGLLREREAHFRSMADNAPAILWVADASGACTYLSRQWYELTGRTPEQDLQFGWFEAVHDSDRPQARDVFMGAAARHLPFAMDYRLRHRDGTYRWAVDAGLPRFNAAGVFEGYVGTVIDVHERKLMEQALEEADRRKDEFLATLAHELRNPLAPLVTALRLVEQSTDAHIVERAHAIMGRQIAQLVRLVDDLLDVSRITRGKLQLRPERVTLSDVVLSATEAAESAIAAKGHRLVVELPPDAVPLDVDATRMSQVFLNLLNNAAKYTPDGGTITVTATRDGDEVTVSVLDTGIGFEPAAAERIFEMFTQTEASRELAQGGLGIGLTLVRQLVGMHRGRVAASSSGPGAGSEFRVTLPVAAPTPHEERAGSDPDTFPATGRRILIADDNRDAAHSLALLLERDGHTVRLAHDGEETLSVAAVFEPEVILLDIGMPRLSGYDAARRLRAMPFGRNALIAAITGWGQPQDLERARAAGIDLHFRKPVEPTELRRLLTRTPLRSSAPA